MVQRFDTQDPGQGGLGGPSPQRGLFQPGDLALLVDRKGRRYMITLQPGGAFHTHVGIVSHNDLIGRRVGSRVRSSGGQTLLAVKPTLADFALKMPRATQVIYSKDLGAILVLADVFPGARVLEAGLGSGALTLALLRATGPTGQVVSYEINEETVPHALRNIQRFIHDTGNLTVKIGDVYQGIQEQDLDRIVLDVPEPWQVVPHAARALVPGGIFLSFLPTVLQVHRLVMALAQSGQFQLIETVELLLRPWHISDRSARPDHRMVAHTGFITTARLCPQEALAMEGEVPSSLDEEVSKGEEDDQR